MSDLINTLIAAGYTPNANLNQFGIVTAAVRNLITSRPATQLPTTENITAAGAVSISTQVSTLVGPAASTYAITLAAPTTGVPGQIKEITMTSTTGTNAVTLALTNVVGQSSGTSASFDAAGETLVLISNSVGKWVVIKEYGVTLS
jgi:hypothetical protein